MTKLRVGVVGLGIGREHVKAYRSTGACDVVALADLDSTLAARVITEEGLDAKVRTFDEMVADPSVQILSIASFDSHHAAQVVRALEAGKHVFVEKPLCMNGDELGEIHRAWKKARTHLRSNLVLRKAPLYPWLAEARAKGELGRLYSFDADYLYGRLQKITDGWRKNEPDYSVMAGGGIHMLDLVLRIAGELPVVVSARGNRIGTEGTPFQFDDFVGADLRFPSGLIGRVNANFACVHPHQHSMRIFGTKATVLIDDQGPRIFRRRGDAEKAEALPVSTRYESKGVLIPDFVRAIAEGRDPEAAANEEFDLMSVVVAIDRAHASAIEVQVEYLR
jgi:predicted dehydrogenase